MSPRARGIVEVITSGVGFGFLGIFGKQAFELGLSPGELLAFRFLIASVLLGALLLVSRPRSLRLPLSKISACFVLGAGGYAIFAGFYFLALQGLSASLTVLLLYLYPVMVALGAHWLYGEKISRAGKLALPFAAAGMVLLVWGDFGIHHPISLLFGIGSAVFYSAYILASRKWLRDVDSFVGAFYIQLSAGVILGALFLSNPSRFSEFPAVELVPTLIGVAIVGTLLPISLFLSGLRKLTSAETSLLSLTEPLTAIIASAVFLHERLSSIQWLGAISVLGALVSQSRSNPAAEVVESRDV